MKWSTLCIVVLLGLALAGQAGAQSSADSYRKAGAAYFKAGQFRDSVKAYQQVIRLKPNDADAYQQLGEAFTRLNMNKEAAEAFEKSADLLTSGTGASASSPAPAAAPPTQNTMLQAQPQPSAANRQLKHKVGERVDYVDSGVWFKAIIIAVRDDSAEHLDGKIYSPFRVHPLGYTEHADAWVCCVDFTDHRSQLRPAGSQATEPVPGGEANDEVLKAMRGGVATVVASPAFGYVGRNTPPPKQYHCVYFVGNHLEDTAPLTITGDSTYTGGTYSFTPESKTLTFHGGVYDGQRAEYETNGGQPQLHILGKSGRRVIDCD
ncbi:MAG TPA: tetratricopeptide repeat protein [Candidatus Binatia bacterium]